MREAQAETKTANRVEIVCFTVEDQDFSIEISHVLEIRGWTSTTTLPHAPDFVVGMMNLRGTVLPVVDLSLRLGFGKTEPGKRHVIIIAQIDDKIVGFLVDAVSDIITVDEAQMQATPDVSSSRTQAFIRGVHSLDDKLVRAIDVREVLPQEAPLSA
ncbi:Chemotaxis protein CheW [Roseovarius sp. THAF27]|uniref:chemotaxis protein CheW n=1 Tax=Roseovarius TaxID=74030 RepID=UPI0012697E2C|nr:MULTISPECIES: chemotaxis protein CheW [Roseovarius]QFT81902.1 Chemotaxis protein CheW [Roseovarius sp. THAF27]QFT98973.1 Chemotaxis protein CheW [Roseovarius sp. THAF8]